MSPTVAVRVDGGRLRFAQFTRVCKGAQVHVRLQPDHGDRIRRLTFAVAGAPGRLGMLEKSLHADGADIETARRDDAAGTWDGTLAVPVQRLMTDLLDRLHDVFGVHEPLDLVFDQGQVEAQQRRPHERDAQATAQRAHVLLRSEGGDIATHAE